jgi:hypothetical protein
MPQFSALSASVLYVRVAIVREPAEDTKLGAARLAGRGTEELQTVKILLKQPAIVLGKKGCRMPVCTAGKRYTREIELG